MSLIIRIDVDRPYGRSPLWRHSLSRLSSDFYFPRVPAFGYLDELRTMLTWLNQASARSYVFFRRCTLPDGPVMELLNRGQHEIGLHLEDSRTYETFQREITLLQRAVNRPIRSFSKHGSGGAKFGYHHHAPYEAEKYVQWAERSSLQTFLGNLEDPELAPLQAGGLTVYPSAFWLEPHWRDTAKYPVEWLLERAKSTHVVLLVHPENITSSPALTQDFQRLIRSLETAILS